MTIQTLSTNRSFPAQIQSFFVRRNMRKLRRLNKLTRHWSEYRSRRSLAEQLGNDCSQDCVGLLNRNGYVDYSPPRELSKNLIKHCLSRFSDSNVEEMNPQEGKSYYLNSIAPEDYEPDTPFMRYALDEGVLGIVGNYIGTAAFLQSIELIYSIPQDNGALFYKTHMFHKDKIDRRIVKLFTYITDVDDRCGPLTLLPLPETKKVPWYAEIPHYIADETVSRYADLSKAISFEGCAGSTIMVDTSNVLHYGSRCEKPRLTFVAHYNSGFSLFGRCPHHERWLNNGKDYALSKLQKFALG